jgi:hypothetical protein
MSNISESKVNVFYWAFQSLDKKEQKALLQKINDDWEDQKIGLLIKQTENEENASAEEITNFRNWLKDGN